MRPTVLHWFRHRQRALTRLLLATFCLAWLQVAAMPCVMAAGVAATQVTPGVEVATGMPDGMPDGMTMAAGEHCSYCPPDSPSGTDVAGACSYPHDPQVDLRLGLAVVLLAPPPVTLLVLAAGDAVPVGGTFVADAEPPAPRAPLSVSLCRFLE